MDDGVVIINCVPLFRRLGVVWPECNSAWFVKDICGIVCVVITWMLIGYAEFVVAFVILLPTSNKIMSIIDGFIFTSLAFLCLASHTRAMLTDPGSVEKGTASKENIQKLRLAAGETLYKCPKCVSIKPERAHHCSVCRRCIRKMDHHCPWVNNCVGEANQKYFVLFTLYIFVISIHALYITIKYFLSCASQDWADCTHFSPPATTVFLIFLLFESLLFGIFTAIMFGSQLSAICTDETGIENLKKEHRDEKPSISWSFKAVFGQPFGLHWLSPFATPKHIPVYRHYDV